jgi:hypothetical protein
MFCAHHSRMHAERLREVASSIHDETQRLTKQPRTDVATEHLTPLPARPSTAADVSRTSAAVVFLSRCQS